MSKTREEVIKELNAILPNLAEVLIGTGYDGEIIARYQDWGGSSGGPIHLLSPSDVTNLISFLQTYLEICPSEVEVSHLAFAYCGNPQCSECYERERRDSINRYFGRGGMSVHKQTAGYLTMFENNGQFSFFASSRPERRLRELEREYSASLRVVHRIETDHQNMLRHWWERVLVDYYMPGTNFFMLPPKVVALFQAQTTQDAGVGAVWRDVMGSIDEQLMNPAHLPLLLSQGWEPGEEHLALLKEVVASETRPN